MNKSISEKVETFVMFLYLRNGKYEVTLFIDCFYLIFHEVQIIIITCSSFTLFTVFFHKHGKSLSKTFYLREMENVV